MVDLGWIFEAQLEEEGHDPSVSRHHLQSVCTGTRLSEEAGKHYLNSTVPSEILRNRRHCTPGGWQLLLAEVCSEIPKPSPKASVIVLPRQIQISPSGITGTIRYDIDWEAGAALGEAEATIIIAVKVDVEVIRPVLSATRERVKVHSPEDPPDIETLKVMTQIYCTRHTPGSIGHHDVESHIKLGRTHH